MAFIEHTHKTLIISINTAKSAVNFTQNTAVVLIHTLCLLRCPVPHIGTCVEFHALQSPHEV